MTFEAQTGLFFLLSYEIYIKRFKLEWKMTIHSVFFAFFIYGAIF